VGKFNRTVRQQKGSNTGTYTIYIRFGAN